MVQFGYTLGSEEHTSRDLVRNAKLAEDAGFDFAMISDHFHPWIDRQGQSPFVWGMLGALSQATSRIPIGTGVTAPTMRIHPAIIAQATATAASLMPGRFIFGVGTGENLNEHILGDKWPPFDVRAEMLEEAIEVIRELWTGKDTSYYGEHYVVENARIYTLPEQLPPIIVAAGGPKAATLAGRIGDGLCATSPDPEVLTAFRNAAGPDAPTYGQVTLCWGPDEAQARKTAHEWWPTAALRGELTQELATPKHFEQATQIVTEEMVAESVSCGPDVQTHVEQIKPYLDAGFSHVFLHQVGPDQEGFIDFCQRELLPALREQPVASNA